MNNQYTYNSIIAAATLAIGAHVAIRPWSIVCSGEVVGKHQFFLNRKQDGNNPRSGYRDKVKLIT